MCQEAPVALPWQEGMQQPQLLHPTGLGLAVCQFVPLQTPGGNWDSCDAGIAASVSLWTPTLPPAPT